jgi:acetyl esterase/lipase
LSRRCAQRRSSKPTIESQGNLVRLEEMLMTVTTATDRAAQSRPHYAIDVEDVEYLWHDGKPLLARLFKPRGDGPFPIMVDLHGGAWCNGDRMNDALINEALAKSGVLVAALDFRMPPQAGYPASIGDINYAVRWLKSEAVGLKARPDRVGMIGISSGGHQAMLSAMRPADSRYAALPLGKGQQYDARVGCVVLCWPVIDPLGRYRYAKRVLAQGGKYPEVLNRVVPLHDQYWGSEEAMQEGSPVAALEKGESVEMPPVLYAQGADDMVHPRADLDRFVAAYRKRGGSVELALYEGEVDGFIIRNAASPRAKAGLERIIAFVHEKLA